MLPTSPFQDRLGSNYVPRSDETSVIQKLIGVVEPQIVSLDAEIEALKKRRAIYASFVADHRALISPIRHMPPDILRNIFSHCVPYDTPDKVMQASEAPLLLVQICRHWRDLALKTPTLWSTIFLKIPVPPKENSYPGNLPREIMDVQIDIEAAETSEALFASLANAWRRKVESLVSLTTAWLSRAEGCPLTIFFRDIDAIRAPGPQVLDEDFTLQPVKLLTSLICARSSQWAHLDLRVTESSAREESFLSLSPSQAPLLRSIRVEWLPRQTIFDFATQTIHQTVGMTPDTGTTSPLHILKATGLQHLSLGSFTGNLKDVPVAWGNLTEFSFFTGQRFFSTRTTSFTPSAALALLQNCPNLVRCELNIFQYTPTIDVNTDQLIGSKRVYLPHLQRFVVSESKDGPPWTLLDYLELPVLDSLTLSVTLNHIRRNENPPPISLRSLLIASGHQIQHLEFGTSMITVTELVDHLKLAEGVTELVINMCELVPQGGMGSFMPLAPGSPEDRTPPPPFYRDELLSMLTPSQSPAPTICPKLAILKLTVADPSNITTRAVKNLVAHRGPIECRSSNGPSQSAEASSHVVPLEQVSLRFSMTSPIIGDPRASRKTPTFPKRWEEDQINSGFSKRIIKVERRLAEAYPSMNYPYPAEVARRPFDTYWDFESSRYERC
ncbi:hypothetical protein BKA70DRAFT_1560202 [Coprinopsis sp. MPI-PUGE-AT-0042]|nr:hypothetical protein BKA70DRAFT_1560202 [Coprinopsis sp. MPI-PUGE-AT-0042]